MGPSSLWLLVLSPIFHLTLSTELRKFELLQSREEDEKIKWIQSKDKCENRNGHLVTLHNSYDSQLIMNIIRNYSISKKTLTFAYLGLRKKNNTNPVYKKPVRPSEWSNEDQMTNWTTNVNIIHEQRCVAIHNNTWSNRPCNERMYFMCYNAADYQLIEKKKDWCEARLYCRKHHTDLVSINNETQNEKALRRGANRTFWIGLKHDNYEWEDGQCSTFRDIREPRIKNDDDCVGMEEVIQFNHCVNDWHVICMQGDTRMTVPTDPLNWEEAYNYCKENHDGLLFISGQDEQTEVEKWINVAKGPGPFWIGLRQSRLFGFWFWSTIDKVVDWNNWKDNTPPELPLSFHCGAIDGRGLWRDVNCKTKLPALCIEKMYPP